MVDDLSKPMCPPCLDIVMDLYLGRVGVDGLARAISSKSRLDVTSEPGRGS
jgi:hypothetical protein